MKNGEKLLPDHHIIRLIPFSKLLRDSEDNVLGVLGAGFALRENESYLSATYLEHFDGERQEQMGSAVHAVRNSDLKVGTKAGFAIGNIAAISNQCRERDHKVRFIYEPTDDNVAHSAVRRWPKDDLELLEIMANETWAELVLNVDVPSE